MPLVLAFLGFFMTEEAVAFLGVTPSKRLLEAHHDLFPSIAPLVARYWPFYEPDHLVPHCTLAMGVADKARVIEVLSSFELPVVAHVEAVHIVEIPGGWSRFAVEGSSGSGL
jgi:hypothetical protein